MSIYEKILKNHDRKAFAVLIDPDKYDREGLHLIISSAIESSVDCILVGGSLVDLRPPG